MRDQYAGDISDYLKFAFLRAVAGSDLRLGMAWYYIPVHDGRADGRHTEYLQQDEWAELDGELYQNLGQLPEQSVAALERLPIWPKRTLFHRSPISARQRKPWVDEMAEALEPVDLVFLDPDNGLGRGPTKHARISDLHALNQPRRAIAIIKFPGRHQSHEGQIATLHQQLANDGFFNPITVCTCVRVPAANGRTVPRHRFFTLVNGDETTNTRVQAFSDRVRALHGLVQANAYCVA